MTLFLNGSQTPTAWPVGGGIRRGCALFLAFDTMDSLMYRFMSLALVGLPLLLGGCGGGRKGVDIQPVSGTVTLDGSPIAGATITFSPVQGGTGKAAVGVSDSNGNFSITDTATGSAGAEVGEYELGVLWYKPSVDTSQATGESVGGLDARDDNRTRSAVAGPDALLPVPYQDPKTSGLKASVQRGDNRVELELNSKFRR